MSCPVGFQNVKNRCVCDNLLNKTFDGITCDIKSNSIVLNCLGWFSYYDGYLRAHQNCPLVEKIYLLTILILSVKITTKEFSVASVLPIIV